MAIFNSGETIICSVLVYNQTGTLTSPATSMKISILGIDGGIKVSAVDMVPLGTGSYYYDFNSPTEGGRGVYTVLYKATDGSRISIQRDTFELK